MVQCSFIWSTGLLPTFAKAVQKRQKYIHHATSGDFNGSSLFYLIVSELTTLSVLFTKAKEHRTDDVRPLVGEGTRLEEPDAVMVDGSEILKGSVVDKKV